MKNKTISLAVVTPVLLSFFVMSAADLVGIGVDNVKADFELSNTLSQLLPMAVFVWFFLLSVPTGLIQDRIGKKNMLNIGILFTMAGLVIPYFFYTFSTIIFGFALLGIGNTILQVSANPLLIDAVPEKRASSVLSFSQFVKAIGSMAAPYMATYFALNFGDWKLVLVTFGAVSLLSAAWLHFTKIEETEKQEEKATISSCLKLLGNRYIALMVLGIFFIVGIDVGINATSGQFLLIKIGMGSEAAQEGRSLFFFGKLIGTFVGALLLVRFSANKFLIGTSAITLVTTIAFIFSPSPLAAQSIMFLIGLFAANIFPLIFTLTVKKFPSHANEISGLMIMAVSGGAIIPPIVGGISDLFSIAVGMYIFVLCALYLLFVSIYSSRKA